jgi:hypothetical protein
MALASCSESPMPTAPSESGISSGVQPATEYWVTLLDATTPSAAGPPPPPGSAPSPWPPTPPAAPAGVPAPTPPSTDFRLHIAIDPEPVLHSGVPVPLAGCSGRPYTWYYDQHLVADTVVPVFFSQRENFFDGRFSSTNPEPIQIPGNGTVVLHTRWCSSSPVPHYTQTRFTGTDVNGEPVVISGPWVRLLSP